MIGTQEFRRPDMRLPSAFQPHVELRLAGRPAAGGNDQSPVRSFNAVNSGGARVFQDRNAFYLIDVYLGQLIISVLDVVHHDEGLVTVRVKRTDAPDIIV